MLVTGLAHTDIHGVASIALSLADAPFFIDCACLWHRIEEDVVRIDLLVRLPGRDERELLFYLLHNDIVLCQGRRQCSWSRG